MKNKMIRCNNIQEHDLPANLKNQKIDATNYLNIGELESFTRHKRQSRSSRGRAQSSRGRQLSRTSSNRQISPAATRRAHKRERERRRRLLIVRAKAIRRSQELAAAKAPPKSNAIKETPKQEPIDFNSLLEDDAFVDALLNRFRERALERFRLPPQGPPPLPPMLGENGLEINNVQEHDLPANLKNQKIDVTNNLNIGELETFIRHKRQSRLSRGRAQSSRGRQLSRRSSYRQLSPAATRRARERERERRRRLLIVRAEELRRAQEIAAAEALSKSNTIKETPKQEPFDFNSLLADDAFVDALMDRFQERAERRLPLRGPPPPRLPPPPGLPPPPRGGGGDRLYVTVSLYLKDSYSKKITFSNNIQEHDLPTSLKNQKFDNTYDLSDESLESLTRYKRQLRNSQKRQQARYRQNQQRQAQKSRQRQRNSLHYRQQRQPRISPAAMRRARERENQYRRRMMAAHADAARRSHKAAESAKSNAMKESPKQEVATSKTLTEEEAYLAKLEEERKKNEKDPSDGKGSNEDKGSEEN
uniref:BZIP domain-containing protein n=1 Tax=Strongyloides stercoralis TaxID=6248 RepID=A0A913HPC9_STRER